MTGKSILTTIVFALIVATGFQVQIPILSGQEFRPPAEPQESGIGTVDNQQSESSDARSRGSGLVPIQPTQTRVWNGQTSGAQDLNALDEETLSMLRSGKFKEPRATLGDDQMEVIQTRYPNGAIQIERHVSQDKEGNYFNHGVWVLKNERGQTLAQGQFHKGLMEGEWKRWHPAKSDGLFQTKPFNLFRGPFLSTANFNSGKLDGVWVMTDANQQKILEIPYRDGRRNGTAIWYYPQGQKMRHVNFRNGTLDGQLAEWNVQSKKIRHEDYIDGRKVVRHTAMFRPKQKESEVYYLDPILKLDGNDNWWDAEPAHFTPQGARIQHGPITAWYDNGQKKMQGQFVNGVRVGEFTWYHRNGQRACTGSYDTDSKVGVWVWWHENGMKSTRGTFENNQLTGTLTEWNKQGQVVSNKSLNDPSTGELQPPKTDKIDSTPPTEGFEELKAPPEEVNPSQKEKDESNPDLELPDNSSDDNDELFDKNPSPANNKSLSITSFDVPSLPHPRSGL